MTSRLGPAGRGHCDFVGCLHLLPLCGSPGWGGTLQPVLDRCLSEAEIYVEAGVDALIVENTHDTPYQRVAVDAGTIAGMSIAAAEVRKRFDLPVGIQILAAADVAAIDVAVSCDLDFIRAEGFAFAHVADEGIIQGEAAAILRRRAHVKAESVEVWTDLKKKHSSHAITADLSLREEGKGAIYCGADGLIVTGSHTGEPPSAEEVESIVGLGARVAVGSGVDEKNIASLGKIADALIVGSACKEAGDWRGAVEPERVSRLVAALHEAI